MSMMHPRILAVLALIWIGCFAKAADSFQPTEYQIKAAFLYNFAKFVEWPKESFKSPQDPIVFGVIGEEKFGPDLEAVLSGKTINDRPVVWKYYKSGKPSEFCHVLFLCESEKRRFEPVLSSLQGAPTLTVADEYAGFYDQGGMINFVKESNKIRFEINATAAEKAGLRISAKLLRLAVSTK